MGDFQENIFLKAKYSRRGHRLVPVLVRVNVPAALALFRASNKSGLNKPNAPRHIDHLILKAVELHGRDWKMVLAFSKRN